MIEEVDGMKKIVSFLVLLTVIVLVLAGCSAKFDVDATIEMLQNEGLSLATVYSTDRELADGTSLINSEISMMGGDFTVELTDYALMIQTGYPAKNCQFFTFATEEQAAAYAELYAASRWVGSAWKIAQRGCVVVITNLDFVQELIELEFH